MSFVSWQYAAFLIAVVIAYWGLSQRGRIYLLLFASYYFYAWWDLRYCALLLTSTAIDYLCGLGLAGIRLGRVKLGLISTL
ncbi:MAG: MBOAT family protein, partial [Verrucomicrobiota bacterium]|nr:MBOAT family protein [Verrucomicrobiota bacterium]